MIHLLNFKGEIIDFISEDDGALFEAKHNRQQKDKKETFDFSILSSRAKKFRERNRVITQDSNRKYREFIITGISDDMDGITEIQTNASYLEDIGTAKPFVPGKLENMTTSQALYEALRDTGWEVAPDTEYNGLKTTTWTEHKAPYDVALQLETTYDMELDFYIELGSNKVEHRYALLKKPKRLFKGKEIVFGKDLTGLSREIDFTEIKTALMVVGPEDDDGNTTEVIVTDDQAQEQFGLPQRYIWDVYKPESQDSDITESRLKALGENELNKIKTASVTYEISSLDIDYLYQHETTSIGDTIRVKDEDFNPPLYLEAEVIGEEYDLLGKESVYTFGKVIRYSEEDLTQFFRQRLQEIREKLNDDITNLNTQLQETVENADKYYEQKIIKQPEPPENPVDDVLWYDTSNPDVAVLRRYRNGEWHNQTASDVQQLGGMTREETIYNELISTFEDLQLQHSMLQSDVYDVINSQYLVDTELKEQVQTDLDSVSVVFNQIKTNLDSMDKDTATIGKLIDTQAMFQDYRENLQKLNDSVQNAKISIDERLKLLQQQYTEEKFNDAMTEVAKTLPNGEWNSETGQLLADIPNQEQLNDLKTTVNDYVDGEIQTLNDNLVDKINTDIKATKEELSASVSSVQEKVDGLEVGGRNLIPAFTNSKWFHYSNAIIEDYKLTFPSGTDNLMSNIIIDIEKDTNYVFTFNSDLGRYYLYPIIEGEQQGYIRTITEGKDVFKFNSGNATQIKLLINSYSENFGLERNFWNLKLEKGTVATDYTPAPEDFQNNISSISATVEEQNTELSLMKDNIDLKADKTTVTQQLGEVESRVEDNTAQLNIQSDEINSKVSTSDYTADQENVVNRLDSAETERQQLSDEINDRVTLTEYQNLNIGTRNLMLNTNERDDFIGVEDTELHIEYELTRPLTVGDEYTLSYEIYDLSGEQINRVSYYPYDPAGEKKDVSVVDNKVIATFTAQAKSEKMYLYKGLTGMTDPTKDFVIKNAMLVEGNKAGDYAEAPEQSDTRLNEMETSIKQNGEQIQDRVSLTEFNESNKTLSQVISTLTQDTTNGLTYTFDENGKITSFNVGNDGVTIRGDSVDITVNDDFKVVAQDLNNKVDQDNIINRLNLSPEGLDIDVNNLGIRGGDNNQYLNIENDTIELHGSYTRTWQGSTDNSNVFTRLKDGHLRFRNNDFDRSIYISDFGISTYLDGDPRNASGTLEFFDYTYDSNARGVTLQSGLGVVALRADSNRMVIEADDTVNIGSNKYSVYIRPFVNTRAGVNEFQYYVKDNPTADETDGVLLYGNLTGSGTKMGSGIRFGKSTPVVYATNDNGDIGSGYFYSEGFQGDWLTKNTNLYACVQSNGSLRVTDIMGYNGGDPNYRDIEAMRLNTYHSYAFANHSGKDVYFGVGYNELRITANDWWNGGSPKYQDIRFKSYYATSSEKYKYDIQKWDYEVLDVIKNDLQLYSFKREEERGGDYERNHRGVVIERETPIEWVHRDGVDNYEMLSWSLKAIQELAHAKDEQDIIMQKQDERIKKLEELINAK